MPLKRLGEHLTLLECPLPEDYGMVQAVLVSGTCRRVLVDTLCSPADVAPFMEDRVDLVIYTHGDWDHCWGTAAFPGVPVIGHALTRRRMQEPTEAALLEQFQAKHPDRFAGARIIPPVIAFTGELEVDAGGVTLRLEHVPGHTADSIWVYLPELEVLLAGDAAEDPFPSLGVPGSLRDWARQLRRRAAAGVRQVVPAHGRVMGPQLLVRNADYIEWLLAEAEQGLARGLDLVAIQEALSLERFFGHKADRWAGYYRTAHRENVAAAVAEVRQNTGPRTR